MTSIWVDVINFCCPETNISQWFAGKMLSTFVICDCFDLKWFLGRKFEFSDGICELCQKKFIGNLLIKFGMSDCKNVSTPLAKTKSSPNLYRLIKPDMDKTTYRSLVGSLNYLALSIRPDISQAVNALSSFLEMWKMEHWTAAKHVLRFLIGTKHLNPFFRKATTVDDIFTGYSDSDSAGNLDNQP